MRMVGSTRVSAGFEDRGVPEGTWEHEFVPRFGQSGSRLARIRGSALGVLSA